MGTGADETASCSLACLPRTGTLPDRAAPQFVKMERMNGVMRRHVGEQGVGWTLL
jgi:hypothetical protein